MSIYSISRFACAALVLCALVLPQVPRPVAAADDTIMFGAAVSLTGREAREGKLTQEGYDIWKDYINSHGGLSVGAKKYKVDIKYYDDESNAQTSAKLVEKLLDQDHVNFILGPYGSSSTFAAAAVVERKKVPMVESNGAAEKIFNQGYKYTFGVLSPAKRYLQGILDMAVNQKPRPQTVAITAANDAFSLEVADGVNEFAQTHNLKVVYSNKYPADATDVSSVVSAIKSANPDIVLNAGHLQDALLIHKGLKEQNVAAKVYGYSVGPSTPDFRNALGKDANYVYGGTQWTAVVKYRGAPGFYSSAKEYNEAFTKKYGHPPDYHNAESTAGCLAFQYAIMNAKSLEPDKVRDALASLDVTTFFGIIKFDSRGLNVFKPMAVEQIQKGTLKTVWPRGVAEAPAMYPAPPWNAR